MAAEGHQAQLGNLFGGKPECLECNVAALAGNLSVNQTDRGHLVFPAWSGPELLMINAVGYERHILVAVLGPGYSREPLRDHNLVHRQTPSCRRALDRQVGKDLVILKKVNLGPFRGRKLRDPFGRFPPRGDHDIGIGDVGLGQRTVFINDVNWYTRQIEVSGVRFRLSGPAPGTHQRANSDSEGKTSGRAAPRHRHRAHVAAIDGHEQIRHGNPRRGMERG